MGRGAELQLNIWRRGERMSLSARLGSAKEKAKEASPDQLIDAYNAILTVFGKDTFPTVWAETQGDLGVAYASLVEGNRAENIELAIKAYEAALTVYTHESSPSDWANSEHNLGNAYLDRSQGSRAENLEAAIKAYEAALIVYTRDAFPEDWAQTQVKLAEVYQARIEGVESPGGVSPPGAPRTVHDPLESHGSRCPAVSMA